MSDSGPSFRRMKGAEKALEIHAPADIRGSGGKLTAKPTGWNEACMFDGMDGRHPFPNDPERSPSCGGPTVGMAVDSPGEGV